MLDHVSLRVSDFHRALDFYRVALAPLGYSLLAEFPGLAGFGAGGKPDFWITLSDKPINPTHVAFAADRNTVTAFHAAGLAAGGGDNGAPGPRGYHANYFGAFINDPDGNNIEACSHAPEPAKRKTDRGAQTVRAKTAPKPTAKPKARKANPTTSKKPIKTAGKKPTAAKKPTRPKKR